MLRLLILLAIAVMLYRWIIGRWPWQKSLSAHNRAVKRARNLLGVEAHSGRNEIVAAHKRLVAAVHPDRGGSNAQVHEANAARDLLIDELPGEIANRSEDNP